MKNQLDTQQTDQRIRHQKPKKIQQTSSQNQSFERSERGNQLQIVPQYIFQFLIPTNDVLDLFQEVSQELKFEMVERQVFHATAIKKPKKKSVFDMLNCLNWWSMHQNVTAVKISIMNNDRNLKKVCCIKGLVGSVQETTNFIQRLKKKLESTNISLSQNPVMINNQLYEDYEFKEQSTNPFHLEACSDYMLHKILSSNKPEEYAISNNLKKLLNDYFSSFKNVNESVELLPSPMKNAITITQESSTQVKKFMQKKTANTEMIIAYFKISIEKYVFDKIQPLLKQIYELKTKQINEKFLEKRKTILTTLTLEEIFEEVLLTKELRIATKTKEVSAQQVDISKYRKNIQYCDIACRQLQKISLISNPRQKIKHCQIMYASVKSYFYDKLNKRFELSSMEDIIPVFITIMLFTDIRNVRSELTMMLDFVNQHGEDCQGQKRCIINLSESLNYIVRDWKI